MKKETLFVSYYRVSTVRQGQFGLGMEAQKAAVQSYLQGRQVIGEYTDVESGKNNSRPGLQAAIDHAKRESATLLIAKLDRLSRNVNFISNMMESRVKFVCCDMPDANELTIHIFAALAQWERDTISKRTVAALKALKERGVRLGKPENFSYAARKKGALRMKENAAANTGNQQARAMAELMRNNGDTLEAIADKLNALGMKTSRGGLFKPTQVSRLLPA